MSDNPILENIKGEDTLAQMVDKMNEAINNINLRDITIQEILSKNDFLIVSDEQPQEQPEGAVWFETGESYEPQHLIVSFADVVVSDVEPESDTKFWFHTLS